MHGGLQGTLKKRVANGTPVDLATKYRFCREIADGMQHLAGHALVHRDLAARNVLLASGMVRVVRRLVLPRWGSIRSRLALGTYAPWGCIVRVEELAELKKIPTRKLLPLFLRCDQVCKVADFGLSRSVQQDDGSGDYYRSSGGNLPVRWTAPEGLSDLKVRCLAPRTGSFAPHPSVLPGIAT